MVKKESLILISLLVLNLILRIYNINYSEGPIFDEGAYYLDAARSYLQNRNDPNIEHPPLGKIIVASGIKVFGDNPYGWRTPAVIFSVLGILLVYLLAKEMFGGTFVPLTAALLISIDNLYFIHSRLAVLEMFLVTFILSTTLFLWRFYKYGKRLDLVLLSISFGLAVSVKWTAFLILPAMLLFIFLKNNSYKSLIKAVTLIGVATLSIYLASYAPYINRNSIWGFLALHQTILSFWKKFNEKSHFTLVEYFLNHAFSWVFNPSWAYDFRVVGNKAGIVNAMFNPAVYWLGLYYLVKSIREYLRSREIKLLFLVLPVVFNILPWLFVRRIEYLYYFLFSLPYLCIITAYYLDRMFRGSLDGRYKVLWIMTTSLALFIFYYPLITSIPVGKNYLNPLYPHPVFVTLTEGFGVTNTYTIK